MEFQDVELFTLVVITEAAIDSALSSGSRTEEDYMFDSCHVSMIPDYFIRLGRYPQRLISRIIININITDIASMLTSR